MSPEEISALFTEAIEQFEPISGQPLGADLTQLQEVLAKILLGIPYDEENGTHNLVGLIMPTAKNTTKYGSAFVRPTKPAIYDKMIAEDAIANARIKAEAKHKAKISDFKVFVATDFGAQKLILAVVEDAWIRELKDDDIFYVHVTSHQILTHLQSFAGGIHTTNTLALQKRYKTSTSKWKAS